eukprot:CAMPEP_0194526650 /NCGR_PEP_ID=MMETSP0253-20130528/62510_1 /TAXON_ID=2966 /ORGANISM="Noctiluca scintillans" /LENGTH=370 /DNA_ID=CAMNT_0039371497 /DNA_START=8 /DNA_END=1120 /DNA_ORIENTATION=+
MTSPASQLRNCRSPGSITLKSSGGDPTIFLTQGKSSLPPSVRKPIEEVEDRVQRQILQVKQEGESFKEKVVFSLERRITALEESQARSDRRVSQLSGTCGALSDEMQTQIRRTDFIEAKIQKWRRKADEDLRALQVDMEHKFSQRSVAANLAAVEGTLRNMSHRMQRLEEPDEARLSVATLTMDLVSQWKDLENRLQNEIGSLTVEMEHLQGSAQVAPRVSELISQLQEVAPKVIEHDEHLQEIRAKSSSHSETSLQFTERLNCIEETVPREMAELRKESEHLRARMDASDHVANTIARFAELAERKIKVSEAAAAVAHEAAALAAGDSRNDPLCRERCQMLACVDPQSALQHCPMPNCPPPARRAEPGF